MSQITVTNIQGQTSGGNANKVIITSGHTLEVTSNSTVGGNSTITGSLTAPDIRATAIKSSNGTNAMTISSGGVVTQPAKPMFRVKQSSDQAISNATATTVQFNDKTASGAFDIGGYFNTSNYRYIPQVAGYYFVASTVTIKATSVDYVIIFISKNGNGIYRNLGMESNAANAHVPAHVSGIIYMNGSSDYLDVQVQHNTGSNQNTNSNFEYSNFNGYLIG